MQLTDIRGHTVTTLDLDSNSVGAWSVYDSFGNPQTSQTNTNLINYSSYGQQERATNTTGLILMGARVYNPETNQFTSKDPIKGGNENSYTYPNDPVNGSDFTGLFDWLKITISLAGAALGAFACVSVAIACLIAGVVIGGLGGFIESSIVANQSGLTGAKWNNYVLENTFIGMATGLIGGGIGAVALRRAATSVIGREVIYTGKHYAKDVAKGYMTDSATNKVVTESLNFIKAHSSNRTPDPKPNTKPIPIGIAKFRKR